MYIHIHIYIYAYKYILIDPQVGSKVTGTGTGPR
jgi:hypothetical protein